LQRCLGDAEKHWRSGSWLFARRDRCRISLFKLHSIHLLASQKLGITRLNDIDLLQHLPDDHLNMLVIYVDALQAIDLLDLVHEIGGEFLNTLDRQNVVRRWISIDDIVALFDDITLLEM